MISKYRSRYATISCRVAQQFTSDPTVKEVGNYVSKHILINRLRNNMPNMPIFQVLNVGESFEDVTKMGFNERSSYLSAIDKEGNQPLNTQINE